MRHKAFTLIELLVVIAIIAILAAILFPVFAQAKLAAKKTVALSNAKEIATANLIYMGDYDDHLVKEFFGFPADCQSWGSLYFNWRYVEQPYVAKSTGLMTDPTSNFQQHQYWTQAWTVGNGLNGNPPDIVLPQNYAVNNTVIGFANGQCAGSATPVGLSTLDQVPSPADTIIILPNRSQWNDLKLTFLSALPQYGGPCGNGGWGDVINEGPAQSCPPANDGPIQANGNQVSWVWCDGHAKSEPPLQTLQIGNATHDQWGATDTNYLDPATQVPVNQAERQNINTNAYVEYQTGVQ